MDLENGIGGISIDSLKIRIPIVKVKLISEKISGKFSYCNGETGEEIKEVMVYDESLREWIPIENYETEFKKRSTRKKENGISTYFAIEKQHITFESAAEFLVILFNSKLLKGRYFEGITAKNIKLVYKCLIGYQVVSFPFADFLNAECTDVDFKKDIIYKSDFNRLMKKLYTQTIESRAFGKGGKPFNNKKNQGIQFSKRETTQFKTNPYFKIYHKEIEFKYNSTEFRNTYFDDNDCKNRVRVETTVKNKRHFRALFKDPDTTLKRLLNFTPEEKELIFKTASKAHLQPLLKKVKLFPKMKANSLMLLNALNVIIEKGISFELARDTLINGIVNDSQRSKKRKELNELYYEFIQGNEIDEIAKDIEKFFDVIGMV
tara:strand:+ start:924 stop:2051 length:1128 start_codon:yes stop_codon:yes gene_type:complete